MKVIYGSLRQYLGAIFHELAGYKYVAIEEGHLFVDHMHMCLSIPPKYAVSSIVGYLKGKSTIAISLHFRGKERNFTGENFWARRYFVSTVGLDEATVRAYFRTQEAEEARYEQMKLGV